MKIFLSVYEYGLLEEGGYGWTQIQDEKLIDKSFDDLVTDLTDEFGAECGWGGIWKYAKNDEDGRITEFALRHKGSSKEYVYKIFY